MGNYSPSVNNAYTPKAERVITGRHISSGYSTTLGVWVEIINVSDTPGRVYNVRNIDATNDCFFRITIDGVIVFDDSEDSWNYGNANNQNLNAGEVFIGPSSVAGIDELFFDASCVIELVLVNIGAVQGVAEVETYA